MTLPEAAAAWVADAMGSPVVEAVDLTGGTATTVTRVLTAAGTSAVLRRLDREPYRSRGAEFVAREWAALTTLAGTVVQSPQPLALDPDGSAAGDPAVLSGLLPGRIDLVSHDRRWLMELAATLVAVHAVDPGPGAWPEEWFSWATPGKLVVPSWASDPGAYEEAFARVRAGAPQHPRRFLHRDFQPGNVLRTAAGVSGVVDWNFAASGPPDLDVAHCASNLASLHGAEVARAFRAAYLDAGGELDDDPDAAAYWQLVDLCGFLPEDGGVRESGGTPAVMRDLWSAHGRPDLTSEQARRGREDLLLSVVRRNRG